MRDHTDSDELAAMVRSGFTGTALDIGNRPLVTGRIPELIASELARYIAEQLAERMGDEEADADADAADWLVATTARLPFGDVIGAQALVDLISWRNGISVAFLNRLLQRAPKVCPIKPGTRAVVWMPSVGQLNMTTRADGVTVIKKPGCREGIELPAGEAAVGYADLDAWLILSHLASVRVSALATEKDRIVGLIDPAILALVGTSPNDPCHARRGNGGMGLWQLMSAAFPGLAIDHERCFSENNLKNPMFSRALLSDRTPDGTIS